MNDRRWKPGLAPAIGLFALAACKAKTQAEAPPPAAAAKPAQGLSAEEVDKLEQERERKGMRSTDSTKVTRDALRMQEKSAERAEAERQRALQGK